MRDRSKDVAKGLTEAHVRLHDEDVRWLKRIAKTNGVNWQIELRQLVRRTRLGVTREITILKEQP